MVENAGFVEVLCADGIEVAIPVEELVEINPSAEGVRKFKAVVVECGVHRFKGRPRLLHTGGTEVLRNDAAKTAVAGVIVFIGEADIAAVAYNGSRLDAGNGYGLHGVHAAILARIALKPDHGPMGIASFAHEFRIMLIGGKNKLTENRSIQPLRRCAEKLVHVPTGLHGDAMLRVRSKMQRGGIGIATVL